MFLSPLPVSIQSESIMLTPPRALQSAPLPPANQRVLVPSHPAATTAPATLSALNTEAVRCRSIMMITIKTSIVIPRECISFLSELCPFMLFPPFPLFSSLTYYYLYVTSRRITPITTETIIWLRWHFVFCSSLFFYNFSFPFFRSMSNLHYRANFFSFWV